jgi:hypothetical protein
MAARNEWRIARICLWWGVFVACVIALIQGAGGLQPWSIITLSALGAAAASTAIFEHGWHRAPSPIGTPIRAAILLALVWGVMALVAYGAWPKSQLVIEVEPQNMLFNSAGDTYDIKVKNRSDSDAYVVELLVRAQNDIGSEDDFDVDVTDDSLHELEGKPHFPPAYDVNAMSCKAAEAEQKLTYMFVIDHMASHETRHITMIYKAAKKVELAGKIVHFETTQTPISLDLAGGKISTRSIPVQAFGCNGIARGYVFRPKRR